ncbi:glycine reductase [Chromatiales bacterium (ex Bugula neritina AB1)]|nr:glycine reductase [Chromatiales bacterium (ex Bugula neritina AB1)]
MDVDSYQQFAEPFDEPIAYRKRVRDYYLALGYPTPYRWAHYSSVPFAPLQKRLNECSIAIVTTAAPYKSDAGDQGPGANYNGAAKFYSVYQMESSGSPDLRISHIAYDRKHTEATDCNSWFPLRQLHAMADRGEIGQVAPRFFGLPTNRSHRTTLEVDCVELLKQVQQDSVDACVLVPNCPVCHQSVSLAARFLECAGISTVVMGCARDIVEFVGVPRLLFSDFPLGNAAGKPHDIESQKQTLQLALQLLVQAPAARTTVQSPQRWSDDPDWKLDFYNLERIPESELIRLRQQFDEQKRAARGVTG